MKELVISDIMEAVMDIAAPEDGRVLRVPKSPFRGGLLLF